MHPDKGPWLRVSVKDYSSIELCTALGCARNENNFPQF